MFYAARFQLQASPQPDVPPNHRTCDLVTSLNAPALVFNPSGEQLIVFPHIRGNTKEITINRPVLAKSLQHHSRGLCSGGHSVLSWEEKRLGLNTDPTTDSC